MEQRPNQTGPEAWQIDPETFRRVWARVMPNEEGSPVAVKVPEGKTGSTQPPKRAAEPARPSAGKGGGQKPRVGGGGHTPVPPPVPESPQPQAAGQEERLRRLMDLTQEGTTGGHLLSGRMGGRNKTMSALAADYDRAMLRLSALYFLLTGQRYQPAGVPLTRGGKMDTALRDQYLWERRWMEACREEGETSADPGVRDLCQELAREAKLHSRALRTLLENSWKPPAR